MTLFWREPTDRQVKAQHSAMSIALSIKTTHLWPKRKVLIVGQCALMVERILHLSGSESRGPLISVYKNQESVNEVFLHQCEQCLTTNKVCNQSLQGLMKRGEALSER